MSHYDHTCCRQEFPWSDPKPKLKNIYFYLTVGRYRYHVCSFRMDRKAVYSRLVSFIVLNDFLGSKIKHTDSFVIGTCQNALISRMKTGLSDRSFKAIISLSLFLFFNIPNKQLLVLSTWTNKGHIFVYFCTINPIIMTQKWAFKFLSLNVPHLDAFIITSRK